MPRRIDADRARRAALADAAAGIPPAPLNAPLVSHECMIGAHQLCPGTVAVRRNEAPYWQESLVTLPCGCTDCDHPQGEAPLAFIYDRHASPTTGPLEDRLSRCHAYAVEQGWHVAGEWIDQGDDALGNDRRPQWYALVLAMERAAPAPVICLVESWERISRTPGRSAALRSRIGQARGYCVTADGETDQRSHRGRLGTPLSFERQVSRDHP